MQTFANWHLVIDREETAHWLLLQLDINSPEHGKKEVMDIAHQINIHALSSSKEIAQLTEPIRSLLPGFGGETVGLVITILVNGPRESSVNVMLGSVSLNFSEDNTAGTLRGDDIVEHLPKISIHLSGPARGGYAVLD